MDSARILFVDDEPLCLGTFQNMLRDRGWQLIFVASGQQALDYLSRGRVDVVVADIRMPGLDGLSLLEQIRKNPETCDIPVIMVTGQVDRELKLESIERGATDLLAKPIDFAELLTRLRSALQLKSYQDAQRNANETLAAEVKRRTSQLERAQLEIVWRMAHMAEYHDEQTGSHVARVGCFSRSVAQAMHLNAEFIEHVFLASPLHDIGKIAIPDAILSKPGKLTPDEWAVMQRHCVIGREILEGRATSSASFHTWLSLGEQNDVQSYENPVLRMAASIAMNHHERWDGTGYPQKLAGEDIPLEARIVAVADVFDALLSRRPYKPALSEPAALKIISEESGRHFDPRVVQAFFATLDNLRAIRTAMASEDDQSLRRPFISAASPTMFSPLASAAH
ncbi:MAG TPA: HD domain-containing phosphohydrolase [Pirellulales bacterium]|jgi:putative two-component system response regulator|nr:HD domain-containing phosphohydrolase [Pirellulales bacterium]